MKPDPHSTQHIYSIRLKITQNKNKIVYVKILHFENGVKYTTQKVCKVIDRDEYDNLTVEMINDLSKEYEIRVLRPDQYSYEPYLMDFD